MSSSLPPSFFQGSYPIILVAGGAGFIGSHFCEAMLAKNLRIICVDNWQTGMRDNIHELGKDPNFCLLEGDITENLLKKIERIDYIADLAGIDAYMNGEDVSIETLEVNSIGVKNLLELAALNKAKFLLASTIGIKAANIGTGDVSQYFGNTRELEGNFSHSEAKRFAEALACEYALKRHVNIRIARLGDTYGPRMVLSNGSPIAGLLKNALYNTPLFVPRNDSSLYPVYVDDVVVGIERLIFSTGTKNAIVAFAGEKIGILSFAETIKQTLVNNNTYNRFAKNLEMQPTSDLYFPERNVAPEILNSSQNIISWSPEVSVFEGIERTIKWFEENKSRLPKNKLSDLKKQESSKSKSFFPFIPFKRSIRKDKKNEEVHQKFSNHKIGFWENQKQFKNLKNIGSSINQTTGKKQMMRTAFLWGISLIFLFIGLPFLEFFIGLGQLLLVKEQIVHGNYGSAENWSDHAEFWFGAAEDSFSNFRFFPIAQNQAKYLVNKSEMFLRISEIGKRGGRILVLSNEFFTGLTGQDSFALSEISQDLSLEMKSLEQDLAFLEAQFGSKALVLNLPFLSKKLGNFDIPSFRQSLTAGAEMIGNAPSLLGIDSKKTYLVLFQNNNELRPTGGFIGSFALLTFDKGRLIDFNVQDVYSADGQLQGHVEPPLAIGKYLGEANWYFRDSNWSPDFPTTADRAMWFVDKELGQKVDGVLAVDMEFAKNLLREFGPIKLPDFGDTITADNFYEKTQTASDSQFFPGSTRKKDYLTAINRQLLTVLTKNSSKNTFILGKTLLSAFNNRHAALYTDNENVNKVLDNIGWDGSIQTVLCPDGNCIADFLYPVEANLGVNKSNYFLTRAYSLDVTLTDSGVEHRLLISYTNKSQDGVWPGGEYKDYFRILLPSTAQNVTSYLVNPLTKDSQELGLDLSLEKGKLEVGTLASVPPSSDRQLVLSWDMPVSSIPKSGQLFLLWQKQIGLLSDPVWIKFNFPAGYALSSYPRPSLTNLSSIGYNTTLSKDLSFNLTWQKK